MGKGFKYWLQVVFLVIHFLLIPFIVMGIVGLFFLGMIASVLYLIGSDVLGIIKRKP